MVSVILILFPFLWLRRKWIILSILNYLTLRRAHELIKATYNDIDSSAAGQLQNGLKFYRTCLNECLIRHCKAFCETFTLVCRFIKMFRNYANKVKNYLHENL